MNNRWQYFLKYWLPVVVWMGVVALFSSAEFRSHNSQTVLRWVLDLAGARLEPAEFYYLHGALRKSAHFISYAVMSAICFRAVRGPQSKRRWKANFALISLGICLAASSADEWHQTWTPGRTGEYKDVLLDMAGALFAQLVLLSATAGGSRGRRPSAKSD